MLTSFDYPANCPQFTVLDSFVGWWDVQGRKPQQFAPVIDCNQNKIRSKLVTTRRRPYHVYAYALCSWMHRNGTIRDMTATGMMMWNDDYRVVNARKLKRRPRGIIVAHSSNYHAVSVLSSTFLSAPSFILTLWFYPAVCSLLTWATRLLCAHISYRSTAFL